MIDLPSLMTQPSLDAPVAHAANAAFDEIVPVDVHVAASATAAAATDSAQPPNRVLYKQCSSPNLSRKSV